MSYDSWNEDRDQKYTFRKKCCCVLEGSPELEGGFSTTDTDSETGDIHYLVFIAKRYCRQYGTYPGQTGTEGGSCLDHDVKFDKFLFQMRHDGWTLDTEMPKEKNCTKVTCCKTSPPTTGHGSTPHATCCPDFKLLFSRKYANGGGDDPPGGGPGYGGGDSPGGP